ncbi:MAG: hypothetical protein ACLFR7_13000 [Opitutales bacterium]
MKPSPTPHLRAQARRLWLTVAVFCGLGVASVAGALGEPNYVLHHHDSSALPIVGTQAQAKLYVDTRDQVGLLRVVQTLQEDIARVTGRTPVLTHSETELREFAVIVGTLGHSALLDRLVA